MAVDPKEAAERVREKVVKGLMRRYYRVGRTGRFYGGIATADCCGCNLACIFCWSNYPREHPEIGRFYQPEEIGRILIQKAKKKGYHQVRISGNEPTLAKDHLMRVIEIVNRSGLIFILETNGTLIDSDFAKDLRDFSHLHVRVSLKGANEEDFARLTQSDRVGFQLQLDGLSHLISHGISCHAAVMVSFSKPSEVFKLKKRLAKIDPYLSQNLEEETVILYPHVRRRLGDLRSF